MEVRKKRPKGFKKEAQGVQVSPLNPLNLLLPAVHGARRARVCRVAHVEHEREVDPLDLRGPRRLGAVVDHRHQPQVGRRRFVRGRAA